MRRLSLFPWAIVLALAATDLARAADEEKLAIAIGSELQLTAPKVWVRKEPKSTMIQDEFAVPAAKGDSTDGRVTVMSAGGSVQANIDRWIGQFSQPDGSETKEKAKKEKKKAAQREIHVVDISGTYADSRGPFAPTVKREGYRMLAAIIPVDDGNFFIKFYGPAKTVGEHEKSFLSMLEGLKKK